MPSQLSDPTSIIEEFEQTMQLNYSEVLTEHDPAPDTIILEYKIADSNEQRRLQDIYNNHHNATYLSPATLQDTSSSLRSSENNNNITSFSLKNQEQSLIDQDPCFKRGVGILDLYADIVNVKENEGAVLLQAPEDSLRLPEVPDDNLQRTKDLDPPREHAVESSNILSRILYLKISESEKKKPQESDPSIICVESVQRCVPQVSYRDSPIDLVPEKESYVKNVPGGFQSKYKQENTGKIAQRASLELITPKDSLDEVSVHSD